MTTIIMTTIIIIITILTISISITIIIIIIAIMIRYWETTPKKREKEAWKIYRTYICIGAPKELNLDMLSRKVVKMLMVKIANDSEKSMLADN